ncbi:MAG: elongation factor P [Spirochaetes bacterium]|nr:elongation factor P [Spirochaetota bacterium]
MALGNTTDLSKGVCIKRENKLWFVTEVFFVSPGKGSAFYRTKIKDISSGKIVEVTLKSGEGVELIDTERRAVQYLYKEGEKYVFMDDENFEQYHLDTSVVGENIVPFLKENTQMILLLAEENPISMGFKQAKQSFKVIEAEPAIKGDTATSSGRPVTIEGGAKVTVPLFINQGDGIIVNVETGEYVERAKD